MKLNEFLDIADDDDMVEVYADDGKTRPCELKLVSVFNVSDWVGGIPDVMDELMLYLNREVTCVATVKLDLPEDGEVVALRVYVEQEEGDENVGEDEEDQDEDVGNKHDGLGQIKTIMAMSLGPSVTEYDGDAFDLTEIIKSTVEARIKRGNLVPAFQGCWNMFQDGRLRFSVAKMVGYVYRVAIHVTDDTLITADELQTTFGNIARSLGFGRYIDDTWCDDHKVGYLSIVDGEIVCAMDFDFAKGA